jgi:hypothetical protein
MSCDITPSFFASDDTSAANKKQHHEERQGSSAQHDENASQSTKSSSFAPNYPSSTFADNDTDRLFEQQMKVDPFLAVLLPWFRLCSFVGLHAALIQHSHHPTHHQHQQKQSFSTDAMRDVREFSSVIISPDVSIDEGSNNQESSESSLHEYQVFEAFTYLPAPSAPMPAWKAIHSIATSIFIAATGIPDSGLWA